MCAQQRSHGDGPLLLERVWDQAQVAGTLTLLGKDDRRASRRYAEIIAQAEGAARGLTALGTKPQEAVGVVIAPTFEAVTALLAVWRAGATAVLLAPPALTESRSAWGARTLRLLEGVGARHVLSGRPVPGARPGMILAVADLDTAGPDPAWPAPDDPALVKFTSGSTAASKAILKTHGALLPPEGEWSGTLSDLQPGIDHRLGWTPLHRRALTSELLYPMAFGVDVTLIPTELVTARPLRWLSALSRTRATFSSGPMFIYRLLAGRLAVGRELDLDLSAWRVAHCGGEAIDVDGLERFASAAVRYGFDPAALCASYGLSETGGLAERPHGQGLKVDVVDRAALAKGHAAPLPADADGARAVRFASVGPPAEHVELVIADDEGQPQPARHVGEIVVRTPRLMEGYLDGAVTDPSRAGGGWFKTGDLGYLADGDLYISGRIKDVIIVNGQNFYASELEQVVTSGQDAVSGCAAIASTEDSAEALVLVVETTDPQQTRADDVVRRVWNRTGLAPKAVVLVADGTLPRTDSGKIQRAQVRALYEARRLSEVS